MKEKRIMLSEFALAIGIVMDAVAVALITKSNLGITAVSALPYTLDQSFPVLSYGTWYYIFQTTLMLILVFLTRKLKKDYFIAFVTGFLFSFVLDATTYLFRSFPEALPFRILYFITGTLLLMIGVGFLLNSGLPIMPQDLFTRDFSAFFKIPYKKVKTVFDISCVVISCIIAFLAVGRIVGIGAGTLLSACINGYGISYFQKLQAEHRDFKARFYR